MPYISNLRNVYGAEECEFLNQLKLHPPKQVHVYSEVTCLL